MILSITKQTNYCGLLLLLLSLAGGNLCAQNGGFNVQGTVTSVTGEEPLPGVNIIIKGTTTGAITDIDGHYAINVPNENDTLVFSFIGFVDKELPIQGRSIIDVSMAEEIQSLSEVVVVGYGTQQKRDLTGAVSQVSAEQWENKNPNTVQDILRGNIAGLNVGFSTSAKGGADLQVRGRTSLNAGSAPLLVLDGAIYYGQLSDINPNDIASIDVLKDASSAAVYGAKAAAGVIIITTKKGKKGKPTITVNSNVSLATMSVDEPVYGPDEFIAWRTDVFKSIDVDHELHRYGDPRKLPPGLSLEEWMAYEGASGDPVTIWLQRLGLQPIEIANYKAGKSVDWYDMVFRNGLQQDHTVSLSGRNENLSYYMSLGYLNNEGIVAGDEFSTVRARINLEGKVNDFLSVGMNTQFADRDESAVPVNWEYIKSNSPWGSEFNEDGTYRYHPNDETSGGEHPFARPFYTDRLLKYTTLNATLFAKADLPFGFTYQLNFSPRLEYYKRYNHESAAYEPWSNVGGNASRRNREIYRWQVDNILRWNKTFNEIHKFDVTLLANAEKYQSWDATMTNEGFAPHDRLGFHNMEAGINPVLTMGDDNSSGDEYSTADALMGRLFYSLKNRYLATLSIRRDGYSAFGRENLRATFTSAAAGWVFTEEEFLNNSSWLNFGKLRLSYGTNGNRDIGRYASLAKLQTGKYLFVENDGTVRKVSQLYVNNMANDNLKWERTTSFNVGLDFAMFGNVLEGSLEAYKTSTSDLLVQRSLPDVLGFDWIWDNLGEVQNKGIEASLNSLNMDRENFKWRSSVNFQLNRNKIVSLYGDLVDVVDAEGNVIGQKEADDTENEWFIGHSIDEIWDMKTNGIWQTDEAQEAAEYGVRPGDFNVNDANNDGLYTNADKEFLGHEEPRFRWTLRNDFNIFKNFDLSFTVYSYWGHKDTYNQAKNRDGFLDRTNSYIFPYWTPENPQNEYARLYSSNGSANFNVYREKSFIRLSNISLAYSLPLKFIQKVDIEDLRLYFNITNVAFYAPEWTFWDPEWDPDVGPGPTPRTFSLGINLTL